MFKNLADDMSHPILNDVSEIAFEHYPDEDNDEVAPCGARR